MENPKHMTQIGLPRGNRRIFLEDYVISYMKQHKGTESLKVALFGHTQKEEGTTKFFVFGAALFQGENKDQECKELREHYFSDYQYLGWGEIGADLPDGFFIEDGSGTNYIEGYYCFYDDNDVMLSYMVEEREREKKKEKPSVADKDLVKRAKPEKDEPVLAAWEEAPGTERVSAREYRKAAMQTKRRPINKLKLSVVITFFIMCVISMRDLFFNQLDREDGNLTKVVTESNLQDAIWQENIKQQENQEVTENEQVSGANMTETSEREPVVFEGVEESEVQNAEVDNTEASESIETVNTSNETVASEEKYHTVQKGDTLTTISIRYYGNNEQVNAICKANNISQPDNIKVGQKLLLP